MNNDFTSRRVRVLVIDDHRVSREFTLAALRQTGCSVKQARCLRQARMKALEWLPEALVIDWWLGDGNGGELVRQVRFEWPEGRPPPRFILLTGESRTTLPPEAVKLGFDRILSKPCNGEELAAAIQPRGARDRETCREQHGDIGHLLRTELADRMPDLERSIIRRKPRDAAAITHQLIAGAAIWGDKALESALRSLHAACGPDPSPEAVADAWCRLRAAADDCLAGVREPP